MVIDATLSIHASEKGRMTLFRRDKSVGQCSPTTRYCFLILANCSLMWPAFLVSKSVNTMRVCPLDSRRIAHRSWWIIIPSRRIKILRPALPYSALSEELASSRAQLRARASNTNRTSSLVCSWHTIEMLAVSSSGRGYVYIWVPK